MHEKQRNGNVQLPCSSGPTAAAATAADVADGGILARLHIFRNAKLPAI